MKLESEPPAPTRRAALYCRVSTFDQNRGEFDSLEDQEGQLRRAAEAEGREVFGVHKEVASSTTAEREQLQQILSEMAGFDAIFVTKLDRLSRSMHDWCVIDDRMDQRDVAAVCTTQELDTSTTMGRFFRDMLMLIAQFEREMTAERIYEKMAEQARRGRWEGGHRTLGYDVADNSRPRSADDGNQCRDDGRGLGLVDSRVVEQEDAGRATYSRTASTPLAALVVATNPTTITAPASSPLS